MLAAAAAHAEPSASTRAAGLFARAKSLLAGGKIADACKTFDAAEQLAPTIATQLNQASCREQNGQLATAWELFADADRRTRAATSDDMRELHNVANFHAHRLDARVSRVTIAVPLASRLGGLAIVRDGTLVESDAWNAGIPIDGGTHKIWVRARGHVEWSATVTLAGEGDHRTVAVPELALVPASAK